MVISKKSEDVLKLLTIVFMKESTKDHELAFSVLKSAYHTGVLDGMRRTIWIAVAVVIFANLLVMLIK